MPTFNQVPYGWFQSGTRYKGVGSGSGTAGAPGSKWRTGSGAPSDSLGANDDLYLDTATGNVYVKSGGAYSLSVNITGPAGSNGTNGTDGSDGADGRSAYQVAVDDGGFVGDVSAWLASLVGPAGTNGTNGVDGATWRSGSGAPDNGTGVNGDYYLRTSNGDVYLRSGGTYTVTANLMGPAGANGSNGLDGLQMSGRLTLETGVAVSTSDQVAKSTLYYTLYDGCRITIWDGSAWVTRTFPSELSLTLASLTSGKNYDVVAYWTGSAVAIDLMPAWASDTGRASGTGVVVFKDGILVNNASFTGVRNGASIGANQGTVVGTIRTTSTSGTEDSLTKRFVCNWLNPVPRIMYKTDATLHTLTPVTVRGWNGATHALEWIQTSPRDGVLLTLTGALTSSTTGSQGARLALGANTTTMSKTIDISGYTFGGGVSLVQHPNNGWKAYYVVESATGNGTTTFYYYEIEAVIQA